MQPESAGHGVHDTSTKPYPHDHLGSEDWFVSQGVLLGFGGIVGI